MQNQGYAAGVAAARAAPHGGHVRDVDIKAIQQHLAEIGAIPECILTDEDSYPIRVTEVEAAVKTLAAGAQGEELGLSLARILAQPNEATARLRVAYESAVEHETKVRCAQVLAFLGDCAGVPTLIAEVDNADSLDAGNHYNAWSWTKPSRLDSIILALGHAGDRRAVGAIVAKLEALDSRGDFSHVWAIAKALETLRDPAAAPALASLLRPCRSISYRNCY